MEPCPRPACKGSLYTVQDVGPPYQVCTLCSRVYGLPEPLPLPERDSRGQRITARSLYLR